MNRRQVTLPLLAATAVLVTITILLNRSSSFMPAGQLQAADVRQIQHTVSHERWKRVARGIAKFEFKLVRSHLEEMLVGRIRTVSSDAADEARVEIREESETGRRWDYQLERQTNGWKVIGFGYRSALIKRSPNDAGAANRSQPRQVQTNRASAAGP